MKYKQYLKKLTPQELGYRKGRLKTGQYFYISKLAIGTFFPELSKDILNDKIRLVFNDPLCDGEIIEATFVYHNDLYAIENGTRNEYRIYLNRDISKHDLHFEPSDIVKFQWLDDKILDLSHYKKGHKEYDYYLQIIKENFAKGNHALLE